MAVVLAEVVSRSMDGTSVPRLGRGLVLIAVASFMGASWVFCSSWGGDLVVDRPNRSMAGRQEGDAETFHFAIRNTTSHPIRIIGADDRCSSVGGCSQTKPIPLTIPVGESRPLEVLFKAGVTPYVFRLSIFTDDPQHPEVVVTISG